VRRLNVVAIFGGRSAEHEVSLSSARFVVENLDHAKYNVIALYLDTSGKWMLPTDSQKALHEGLSSQQSVPALVPTDRSSDSLVRVREEGLEKGESIDVVFPVLHGPCGEDGTVQGLLDLAGLPYVGSGILGSAVGMDKAVMKKVFEAHGLPVADFLVAKKSHWLGAQDSVVDQISREIGYPCFVKPANMGSSIGISKVHDEIHLPRAMDAAAEYDVKIIVEEAVPRAREIECGILGNDEPIASLLGECVPSNEFYDYEAKYIDEKSQLIVPADLPDYVTRRIREIAVQAFLAIDCAGMARVDFLVRADSHEVYLGELNTIPCFTPSSMYPRLWKASGVPHAELLDRLIQLALERHKQRSKLRTSQSVGK